MKSEELRHRITIQQATITDNGIGGQIKTWSIFATVWAKAKSLTGREYWLASQVNAEKNIEFEIRYLAGVNETMRVIYGSKTLEIVSANDPEERGKRLVIVCKDSLV